MLSSLRIAVPRTTDRVSPVAALLRAKGATVHDISLSIVEPLTLAPLQVATRQLASYQWALATSPLCLERLVEAARATNTAYLMSSRKLAIAGTTTIELVESLGWTATVQLDRAPFEAILDGMATRGDIEGSAFLYPAIIGTRDALPDGVRALGATIDTIPVARLAQDRDGAGALQLLLKQNEIDLIAASTPAIVDALFDVIPPEHAHRVRLACIGPMTARAARTARFTVAVEATTPTPDGLVASIVASVLRAS